MPKEANKPATEHRVSEGLVNEILSENDSIAREGASRDDKLEKDSELKISETQFREKQFEAQIDRYKQDTELRKTYADKVFSFMAFYTFGMFVIVFLSG